MVLAWHYGQPATNSLVNRLCFLSSAAMAWSAQLAAVAMTIKAARRAHDWDGLITSDAFPSLNVKERKERLLAHWPAREKSPQHRKVGEHRVSLRDRDGCPSVTGVVVIGRTCVTSL
jgi:hypothetical protein